MAARRKEGKGASALVAFDPTESAVAGVLDPEMQALIEQESGNTMGGGGGWPFLSTANARFKLGDGLYDTDITAIVLAETGTKAYYDTDYVPDQNTAPRCWAIMDPTDSEANANAMKPGGANPVSDECRTCPNNKFKSDNRGKGKACRDYKLLAILPAMQEADLTVRGLQKNAGMRLRIPPTSIAPWESNVRIIHARKQLLAFVVQGIHIEPDEKKQFTVEAEPQTVVMEPKLRQVLLARRKEALEQIQLPPPEGDGDTPGQRRTPAGRKTQRVAKKRGAKKASKISRSRA